MVRFYGTAALLMIASASAFAPSRPVGTSAFVQQQSSSYRSTPSSTMLHMNLFDRFQRVAKSNLNNILKNLEDPEKIMNQAVEDMQVGCCLVVEHYCAGDHTGPLSSAHTLILTLTLQADLVKVRQSYAEITATQRRLLKQKEQSDAIANDWYKRAQLALEKGNEELAREALSRRQAASDESQGLQQQIDAQAAAVDRLYEGMQILEKKILESKAKKEQMIARARTAQSTQKVNDMLSGISGKTSMDAFNRMEEKVEALEAAAEVSAEMGSMGGNALPGSSGGSLEAEFRKLEAASSVDAELQKMKGLLTGSSEGSSSSSSSSSKSSGDAKVDDELEKMKREAGL